MNQQGNDTGRQYRSGMFYTSPEQKTVYDTALQQLAARDAHTPAVALEELRNFYNAEEYHQDYLDKNPGGYCGLGGTGVSCPIGVGVGVGA